MVFVSSFVGWTGAANTEAGEHIRSSATLPRWAASPVAASSAAVAALCAASEPEKQPNPFDQFAILRLADPRRRLQCVATFESKSHGYRPFGDHADATNVDSAGGVSYPTSSGPAGNIPVAGRHPDGAFYVPLDVAKALCNEIESLIAGLDDVEHGDLKAALQAAFDAHAS
jgi:hypothetical protein